MARIKYPTESKRAEANVLRLGIDNAEFFPNIPGLSSQAFVKYSELGEALIEFWEEHNVVPDEESFATWCQDEEAADQFEIVMRRQVVSTDKGVVFVTILRDAMIGRGMLDIAGYIADDVGKDPHRDLLKRSMSKMTDLTGLATDKATTTRFFYWESAPARWARFEKYADNPQLLAGIPFGIKSLDDKTRGLHSFESEADLIAIFGKSGSYKSRFMQNLCYNQATRGVRTMLINREMSSERVGLLLDARESLLPDATGGMRRLDYGNLENANLVGRYRKRYKTLLTTLYKRRRYPLWLVDCPDIINTADIIREIELYFAQENEYPQVIYIDYANLVDPVGKFDSRQENQKLDRLFVELLGITKGYRIPIVTAIRESRTGSLKREREEVGMEHVGLSQAIAYHVHQLWHLDQTREDRSINRLWLRSKKNRYGEQFELPLCVLPEYNYIGDQEIEDYSE